MNPISLLHHRTRSMKNSQQEYSTILKIELTIAIPGASPPPPPLSPPPFPPLGISISSSSISLLQIVFSAPKW